jgi:hypothetical protein
MLERGLISYCLKCNTNRCLWAKNKTIVETITVK